MLEKKSLAGTTDTPTRLPNQAPGQRNPTKPELLAIAEGLKVCDPAAVGAAIGFLLQDSRGHWHNRARAKFARRLKHCPLTRAQARAIVDCVASRLERGQFPEQFTDQLRLALHLEQPRLLRAAERALASPFEHVRRYGGWVIQFHGAPDALQRPSDPASIQAFVP